jgi:hypothetical protein
MRVALTNDRAFAQSNITPSCSSRTEVIPVAQKVIVSLVDDLDGSTASTTVEFALDGRSYEIDLSDQNADGLRKAFAQYVESARKAGGGRRSASPAPSASRRQDTAAIRTWAQENGHTVSDRGRIPTAVIEAYENRNVASATEEPKAKSKKAKAKGATGPAAAAN